MAVKGFDVPGLFDSRAASFGMPDYCQVGTLGLRYKSIIFDAEKSTGPPNQ